MSAGIGEALQRSAASFNAANTGLSKSIALITGTNEVVQNPESVGTMWKTVSMRIRGATKDLEAAGLETEGMAQSTSELRDYVKDLTGFDIMADEAGTQFKDIYDIIIGIGEAWNSLADVDQAALLEKLAGKRQGNALAAALNNIDTIKKVYETAEFNSSGSAQKENEKHLDSIKGRVENLKTSFQELSSVTLDSGFVKGLISGFTQVLDIITTVIDKIGVIPTIISGIGIGAFIKYSARKTFPISKLG